MENKKKQQFRDEIYMLGEQKEFSKGSVGGKKTATAYLNPFSKSGKDALVNQRKSYNYTFVQICDKYGIEGDIYQKLDDTWNEAGDLGDGPQMIFRILAPAKAIETANVWSNYITHLTQSPVFLPKTASKVCQNDPFYAVLGQIFSLCITSCVT